MNDPVLTIAPILRGILAERCDNEDWPYRPPQLTFSTEGPTSTACRIGVCDPTAPTESLRTQLKTAVDGFGTAHEQRYPDEVLIENVGLFTVVRKAQAVESPLAGRVAVVTGAAGAIGYGVCTGLLAQGVNLAVTDLPGARLEQFAHDLEQTSPGRVLAVPLDVTSAESTAQGFAHIVRAWGGVDLVVINAGIAHVARLTELDLDAFRRLEQVNVEGTLLTLKQTADIFIRQSIGGDVVIMSTKNVPSPGAGFGAYSATKAACHQLGRIASLELAPHGVRVNMVAPDAVFAEGKYKSGLWQEVGPGRMKARGLDEQGLQEYYRNRNLLKARVTGRHVGNAVVFLASRQVPVTGITIPVDGGLPDATPR